MFKGETRRYIKPNNVVRAAVLAGGVATGATGHSMVLDAGARYTENIQQIERATQQMTPDEIKRNPNAVFENVQETVGVMNERHDEKSRGIALMFVGYSAAFAAGLGIRIRKR